jgi:membrane-bound lytic murein transglycosylase B
MTAEASTPVTIIDLPTPAQPTQYKLGLQNFYVLTRYNRSFFYALAVYELGQRVKARIVAETGAVQPGAPASTPAPASVNAPTPSAAPSQPAEASSVGQSQPSAPPQ